MWEGGGCQKKSYSASGNVWMSPLLEGRELSRSWKLIYVRDLFVAKVLFDKNTLLVHLILIANKAIKSFPSLWSEGAYHWFICYVENCELSDLSLFYSITLRVPEYNSCGWFTVSGPDRLLSAVRCHQQAAYRKRNAVRLCSAPGDSPRSLPLRNLQMGPNHG